MSTIHDTVGNNMDDMFHELSTNSHMWESFIETLKHPVYYAHFNTIIGLLVEANVDEHLVTNYYKYMVYPPSHNVESFPVPTVSMPNVTLILNSIDKSTLSYREIVEDLFTLTGQRQFNLYLNSLLIEMSTTVIDIDNYMDAYTESPDWISKLLTYGRITPPALTLFIKRSISKLPDHFFHNALTRIYNSESITHELRDRYDEVIMNGHRRQTLLGFN